MRQLNVRPNIGRTQGLAALALAPLVFGSLVASCSSSSPKAEPCPASVNVDVKALDSYRFDPPKLTATAGKFVVRLTEAGSLNHTFQIHGADGQVTVSADSKTACATFTLAKGTYKYFCSVSGHESQGMKGDLTVS